MASFLIIGAGIGGLTTAHALLSQGHTVQVYEAAAQLREIGAGVVLGANATRSLARLRLQSAVQGQSTPITHLSLCDQQGRPLQTTDPTYFARKIGFDNLGIHRAALQRVLLAGLPAGIVRLSCRFERFEATDVGVTAYFTDNPPAQADALIGADGLHSAVRRQVLPQSRPRFAGYTCWRAVVDGRQLALPVGDSVEIWGNGGRRIGYVPVGQGQVYWFACLNSPEPRNPYFAAFRSADLQRTFADFPAPISDLLAKTTDAQLLWNDILDLPPLSALAYGRVLLIGDAGHATTPNMGQGAGQAVEDAAALAECLLATPDLTAAFRDFERRRLPRTTRIVNTSWYLGQLAQLENPVLVRLRNTMLRLVPKALSQQQMAWLYEL